jgi:hypothetical protein
MADSPFTTIQLSGAELRFMLGAEDDAATVENVDAEVILRDGSRWSATFLSVAEIARILKRWQVSGECSSGAYFRCPDLIVVSRGGIDTMGNIIRGILASGDLGSVLTRIDIEE